jgi:hypothetical protein
MTESERKALIDRILSELDLSGFSVLAPDAQDLYEGVVMAAGKEALLQVGIAEDEIDLFNQVNEFASKFAAARGAELVGMKYDDEGNLVVNPDPKWAITDGTRELLRAQVGQAIDEGWSSKQLADAVKESYAFSDARAENIGRTEIARAQARGTLEGWKASGVVTGKQSLLASEHDVDDECDMNREAGVIPIDQDFPSGDPCEPYHPACLLPETIVAASGVTAKFKRWYKGEIVRIRISDVNQIAITPNHPILTERGFIAAGQIEKGDYLIYCTNPALAAALMDPDDHYVPAPIEQIARALGMARGVTSRTMPVSAEDFHGDGIPDSEVDIVFAGSFLESKGQALLTQSLTEFFLFHAHGRRRILAGDRAPMKCAPRHLSAANSIVSSLSALSSNLAGLPLSLDEPSIRVGADIEALLPESSAQRLVMDPHKARDLYARLASLIEFVQVRDIRKDDFAGHVYNLSTHSGLYIAEGLVVHNCECATVAVIEESGDQA